jgi:hypothetical protein
MFSQRGLSGIFGRVELILAAFAVAGFSQVMPTGTVQGLVTDPASAVVPAVHVKLANLSTGIAATTLTNAAGFYTFPTVMAGRYRLEASRQGFQTVVQEFTVQAGIKTTIDVPLPLGEVTQRVDVTAGTTVLETASASLSTVVNNRAITDLPLAGRNPYQLVLLSPGVTSTRAPGASQMDDISGSSYFSTNGSNMRMNGFLMDGVMNTVSDRVAYIPPVDLVEEFNVHTNSFDAEYGYASGAIISVVTKSGTNAVHGSVYEFLRNSALNANAFFNNSRGIPRPQQTFNQFGTAVGGPIVKNRAFWFFNYEGIRDNRPSGTGITSVPTPLQRQGDFSQTFDAGGNLIRIYDPFSTTQTSGGFVRQAFPNNRVPQSMFDPVSRVILDRFIPNPTSAGDPFTQTNNYSKSLFARIPMDNFSGRADYHFSEANQLFARFSVSNTETLSDYFLDVGGANLNNRVQTSIAAGDTLVFSPSTLLTVSGGYTRWTQEGIQPDTDMTALGFPASFVSLLQQQKVPRITTSDMLSNSLVGAIEGSWFEHTNTWTYQANMKHTRGRHALKWGFQSIIKQNNSRGARFPMGIYAFDRSFTQGPDPTARGSAIGHGTASYLLGTPASGQVSLVSSGATNSPFYGWYFHDDIRVSPRLTLNLGLRYEVLFPATERFDRSSIGYASDTPNPIEAAAKAAYARNPLPELPVDQFRVMGGLLFAGPDNRRNGAVDSNNWSPRIGIAFKATNRTVLRAGYGRFHTYWWAPFTRDTGFSSETPFLSSLGNFLPENRLTNPFPGGLAQPVGSSQGLATLLGTNISFYDFNRKQGYNDRISIGFQQDIGLNFRLEANYVGQWAEELPVGSSGTGLTPSSPREQDRELDFLPAERLPLRTRLAQRVPNPFFGLIETGPLAASTVSVQELLTTYPHFTGVTSTRETTGSSTYHSLQVTGTRNYSNGLQFVSAYTWSKQLETVRFINVSDPGPSRTIGEFDRPHRFTFGGIYELPLGPGKRFAGNVNRVAAKLLGGWQVSGFHTFQSGEAVPINEGIYGTGEDPLLEPGERSIDRWFNGAAFRVLPEFTLRDLSYTLARLRADAINNLDLSVMKNTAITERVSAQIRCEMFNALNRPQFARPNTNPNSGGYTRITGTANSPRSMQFGLKIIFWDRQKKSWVDSGSGSLPSE